MIQKPSLYPVILAGGNGTRLWPLSRKSYPKQFADVFGDISLFQRSAQRVKQADGLLFQKPTTVTNADFRFIIGHQLSTIGIDASTIMIEPEGKNTAPAILAACLEISRSDPDAIILVTPSDHLIDDVIAFHNALTLGIDSAMKGNIVTFGVTPTYPETGFGYLALKHAFEGEAVTLEKFVEKPDLATAHKFLATGQHLWNAGIFLFRAADMITAFTTVKPALCELVQQALERGQTDLDFLRLDETAWGQCENISLDYAIMEHITNRTVVPLQCEWKDLGGWEAIWKESQPDDKGVASSKNTTAIDCENTLLRSESNSQHLVGLGLENIIAVAMTDAVLVADKNRAQDVRLVVEQLKKQGTAQAETFPVDHRPWGWFETLIISDGFQVKQIFVKPGASLSLQSHKHRSEHWIVTKGNATVTINDDVTMLEKGQSTFIPLGAIHRLENKESHDLEIIEVQLGSYLGEDDIIRYDDIYARS